MDHSAPTSSRNSDSDRVLALGQAQATLFAPRPTRLALAQCSLPAAGPRKRIQVWRNHAFEPLVEPMQPYLAFGRWQAEFALSDYDDSLMFAGLDPTAELHLLWLDNGRLLAGMPADDWRAWLLQRLAALRAQTTAPILVAGWTPTGVTLADAPLPGIEFADLGALCAEEGAPLLDARNATFAGSPLSRQAQIAVARALACRWLPALLLPPVKALALDLDHTLYQGVLGEDGAEGLTLSDAHRALQQQLLALRDERGCFLALVSRNERADVEHLLKSARAHDFPLQWQHFSATEIGWGDKASALARIAEELRIGLDAIVYVDDNPGELAQVATRHPQLRTVWADPVDAGRTAEVLRYFPALWRWHYSAEDGKRVADAAAHAERAALAAQPHQDPADYFRSLQVTLSYRVKPADQLARLADLCVKTNQFNLALRRFNGAELQQRFEDPAASVVSVALSDRLSDSGVIAVLVAEREGTTLRVRELCISCRALGRQLEDSIVAIALQQMQARLPGCERVAFDSAEGPRNQPARDWLARWSDADPRDFQAPEGVTLRLEP